MIPKCIKLLQFCKTFKFYTLLNQECSKIKNREGKYGKTSYEGFQAGNMARVVPFLQVFYMWKFVVTEPGGEVTRLQHHRMRVGDEGGELKGHCLPSCTKAGL